MGAILVGLHRGANVVRSEPGIGNDERDVSVEVLKAAMLGDRGTAGTGGEDRG